MLTNVDIVRMSSTEKIGASLRRSLPHLPAEARSVVESMLRPEALAIIAGTLVVWAESHFFGTIILGGVLFHVSISIGPMPREP